MSVARVIVPDFPVAEVFQPLIKPARYKGAYGGRGSGKSHFFADLLVSYAIRYQGLRAVGIREIQKSLVQSVKHLIEQKIEQRGLQKHFQIQDKYIRTPGDGLIIFEGMQNHTADSIKSLEGFSVAWIEEAQALSDRSLELLRPTIRTPGSEIWSSWNPNSPKDAIDIFLRGDHAPPGSIVVKANWCDNPWFKKTELVADKNYDQRRDPARYAHIWMGEYREISDKQVFKNWRIDEFDTPNNARFYFGADWGFSNDPTVLVRAWVQDRTLYIDKEAYKIGCEIDHIPDLFNTVPGASKWPIVADSARADTISYVKRKGRFNIKSARKGPGSIEDGIEFLKNYDIVVHPECTHTIDELTMYSYKIDRKTNEVVPVLEDKDNHVIDALRYAVENLRKPANIADFLD